MASKTTLNAKNLEALGAAQLAELLMEISEGNANAKRRLRFELAGAESPDKLGNEIRKRLTAIGAATTNVGWRTLKAFRSDLNTQRRLIAEQVATSNPEDAADLMWQLISLGDDVIERTSDASGGVVGVFRDACQDLGRILPTTQHDVFLDLPRIVAAVTQNTYGQNDTLITDLATHLGHNALVELRSLVMASAHGPAKASAVRPRSAKRWRKRVLTASESLRKRPRSDSIRVALLALADALGDVDAYIALQTDRHMPAQAARIARRLLDAGKPDRALQVLDETRQSPRQAMPDDWSDVRILVLEALVRKLDAQQARLDRFHHTLDAAHLRAYLKRLPDFDDIEAEDEALDFTKTFPDANAALAFLITWPALERAADMVLKRAGELDGNDDKAMTFAADRLSSRYPLAALRLHRQIVEAALIHGSDKAQEAAVLPFLEAESLARHIDDFGQHEDHKAWRKRLDTIYARRRTFWNALPASVKGV